MQHILLYSYLHFLFPIFVLILLLKSEQTKLFLHIGGLTTQQRVELHMYKAQSWHVTFSLIPIKS